MKEKWEIQTIKEINPNSLNGVITKVLTDEENIYTIAYDSIRTYKRNTGRLIWTFPNNFVKLEMNITGNFCLLSSRFDLVVLDNNAGNVIWELKNKSMPIDYSFILEHDLYIVSGNSLHRFVIGENNCIESIELLSTSYSNFKIISGINEKEKLYLLCYKEEFFYIITFNCIERKIEKEEKVESLKDVFFNSISTTHNYLVLSVETVNGNNYYFLDKHKRNSKLDAVNLYEFYSIDEVILQNKDAIYCKKLATGEVLWSKNIDSGNNIVDLYVNGDLIFCLFENTLEILDGKGDEMHTISLDSQAKEIIDVESETILVRVDNSIIKAYELYLVEPKRGFSGSTN